MENCVEGDGRIVALRIEKLIVVVMNVEKFNCEIHCDKYHLTVLLYCV